MRDRRKIAREAREKVAQQHELDAKRRIWHKPTPAAWCLMIAGAALLFGLSIWQLQRLAWKEGLMADIARHQYSRAYADLPVISNNTVEKLKPLAFARFMLSGTYMHDKELHLAARYYNSQLGYHILTPFQLDDGRVVIINRGWVHVDHKDQNTRPQSLPEGTQHIVAMLRLDNDRNYFTPDHDVEDNIWFWRDISAMSDALGLELYPAVLDALYDIPPGNEPIPSDGLIRLRNDHLSYAITWALIGISGLLFFFTYHYKPRESIEDNAA